MDGLGDISTEESKGSPTAKPWGENLACRVHPIGAPKPKEWPPKETRDAALWFGHKLNGVISG